MKYALSDAPPEVLGIIDSFRRPDYIVMDMERDGFTHLRTVCPCCDENEAM
jgi:hypothetical protein